MNKRDKEILMTSVICDDAIKCISTFKHFKLVLDESFFDYELLKVALDRKCIIIANFLINEGCRVRNPNKINFEETPLHLAMKFDDLSIVWTILGKGASIYDKNFDEETPLYAAFKEKYYNAVSTVLDYISICDFTLGPDNEDDVLHFHIACIQKHINSVKLYLANKFDVNSYLSLDLAEFSGLTPLHYLVSRNDYGELFDILLECSDLSIKNSDGLTPLHSMYYYYCECIDQCKFFNYFITMARMFEHGNNSKFINAVDNNGVSHFHLCCSINNPDIVQIFIKSGVDINSSVSLNSSVNPGFTPLHFAVKYECSEIVELLLKTGADCNRSDKNGVTPLHLACANYETIKITKMLLEYNACPFAVDETGNTPIHVAFVKVFNYYTNSNARTIFDKLMSKISSVNLTNKNGLSFFHIVCTRRNNTNQVNNFLNSGIIIDSRIVSGPFCGYTALYFAILFNQKDVVEVLLKRNAQVNIKTDFLATPLHIACEFTQLTFYDLNSTYEEARLNNESVSLDWISNRTRQLDIIKLLLLHGADVDAKDEQGKTPLFRACILDNYFTANWPGFFDNIMINEINTRLTEIINILLSNKASITACTDQKWSILHAISASHLPKISDELVEYLITAGADVNAVNEDGLTPLHFAARCSKKELVQIFLKHKANINVKCNASRIPLQVAIETYKNYEYLLEFNTVDNRTSNKVCINILLENGSDVNVRTQSGRTLLHDAVLSFSTFLTNKLLYHGADINMEDSLGNSTVCSLFTNGEVTRINVSCVIFIHVQKLLALGLYVNNKVQKFCIRLRLFCKLMLPAVPVADYEANYNIRNLDNIFDECLEELSRMKLQKIDNYTSLYSILLKDLHELSKHVKNKSLIDILEREDIDEQFPLYSYLLKLQYKKGLLRSDVLKSAKASIIYLTGLNLPDSCCDSILRYLTNEEVVNLKAAVPVKDDSKKKSIGNNSSKMEPSIKLKKRSETQEN